MEGASRPTARPAGLQSQRQGSQPPRVGGSPPAASTLDFLVRLLRWRKMILINTLVIAVLAVVLSLLMPNWYAAYTSILPPEEDTLALGPLTRDASATVAAASQARLALTGRMSLPMWASPSDLISGILRSSRLRQSVIREHDLLHVYKVETMDEALAKFRDRARVRVSAEGIVRLRVLDKVPERAAAIASSCLRELDAIRRDTRHSSAAAVRAFIDERLAETERDLTAAEESLRVFQQRHGLLLPEEQVRALVETIARVEAERLLVQVERDALVEQVGATHPEVQALENRLHSLEDAKGALEGRLGTGVPGSGGLAGEMAGSTGGATNENAGAERSAIIDLGRMPDLNLAYLRLYRDLEIQEALFQMLMQMREQYRIIEVRDTPTVQVLSPPVVPEKKAKPRRSIICVVATLLAFLLSLGLAAILERIALLEETDPHRFAQVQRLLAGLWLGFLVRRRRAASGE